MYASEQGSHAKLLRIFATGILALTCLSAQSLERKYPGERNMAILKPAPGFTSFADLARQSGMNIQTAKPRPTGTTNARILPMQGTSTASAPLRSDPTAFTRRATLGSSRLGAGAPRMGVQPTASRAATGGLFSATAAAPQVTAAQAEQQRNAAAGARAVQQRANVGTVGNAHVEAIRAQHAYGTNSPEYRQALQNIADTAQATGEQIPPAAQNELNRLSITGPAPPVTQQPPPHPTFPQLNLPQLDQIDFGGFLGNLVQQEDFDRLAFNLEQQRLEQQQNTNQLFQQFLDQQITPESIAQQLVGEIETPLSFLDMQRAVEQGLRDYQPSGEGAPPSPPTGFGFPDIPTLDQAGLPTITPLDQAGLPTPTGLDQAGLPVARRAGTAPLPGDLQRSSLAAPDIGSRVDFVTPETVQLTPEATVAGQLDRILAEDSPLMQRARQQGLDIANARGLLNSSIGAEIGVASMIDQALNVATPDAAAMQNTIFRNQDAVNAALTYNAEARNVINRADQAFRQQWAQQRRAFDETAGLQRQQFEESRRLQGEAFEQTSELQGQAAREGLRAQQLIQGQAAAENLRSQQLLQSQGTAEQLRAQQLLQQQAAAENRFLQSEAYQQTIEVQRDQHKQLAARMDQEYDRRIELETERLNLDFDRRQELEGVLQQGRERLAQLQTDGQLLIQNNATAGAVWGNMLQTIGNMLQNDRYSVETMATMINDIVDVTADTMELIYDVSGFEDRIGPFPASRTPEDISFTGGPAGPDPTRQEITVRNPDGTTTTIPAGTQVELRSGQTITLPNGARVTAGQFGGGGGINPGGEPGR